MRSMNTLSPVYTIQQWLFVQHGLQTACTTRFDNRLYRVNGVLESTSIGGNGPALSRRRLCWSCSDRRWWCVSVARRRVQRLTTVCECVCVRLRTKLSPVPRGDISVALSPPRRRSTLATHAREIQASQTPLHSDSLRVRALPPFCFVCLRSDHIYFHPVVSFFYLLLSSFFSSPNLSGRRLDVCHTSAHGVALVQI